MIALAAFDPVIMRAELTRDEGLRSDMYEDSRGNMTVGIGHNMSIGQSTFAIDALYQSDLNGCVASLDMRQPWWRQIDPVRQRVLIGMTFNLGGAGLARFTTFLGLLKTGQHAKAAADLLAQPWAKEVGDRGKRYAYMIANGRVMPETQVSEVTPV